MTDPVETTTDDDSLTEPASPQQWKAFEQSVAILVARLDPDAEVHHNVFLSGRVSKQQRQVDVLVKGSVAGSVITVAIECKRYAEKLGIGKIDEFAGKLMDLGVQHGLLYSLNGVTSGAAARAGGALQPRIELRQIAEEHPTAPDWAEGLPEFTGFGDCPNDNCYTGDVSWRSWPQSTGSVVEAGSCEHCGTWAVRCPECGSETGFFSDDVDCEGCERRFALVMGHKAVDYEDVVMLDGRA